MLKINVLLGLLLMASTFQAQSTLTTRDGNKIINHTNNQGQKIRYGQTVLLNLDTWLKDTLIQSSLRDEGRPRQVQIPDSSAMIYRVPAPLEALLYLTNGDSATVLQPIDTLMRHALPKELQDLKEVRFEIQILDILTPEKLAAIQTEKERKETELKAKGVEIAALMESTLAQYKSKKLGDKLKKTTSGLEYVIIEQGTGAAVKDGDHISTDYYGVLKSKGTMFDNSYDHGGAAPFTVGNLIPGFNEGMKLLNRGGKGIIFIPYALAYGDQTNGPIPAKSDLVFYIDLEH